MHPLDESVTSGKKGSSGASGRQGRVSVWPTEWVRRGRGKVNVRKALAGIVVIGSLALPSGTNAAPTERASRVTALAGTTVVTGRAIGYARVRVTESIDPMKLDASIEGDGRVISVVIAREEKGPGKHWPALEVTSFGHCGTEPGCKPDPDYDSMGWTSSVRKLKPGIYGLYLIADGEPARVTLRFAELDGRARVAPTLPAKAILQSIEPQVQVEATRSVYSAGATAPFRGPGLAMMAQTIHAPGTGTAVWGSCFYEDEPPADETTAYMPPSCPDGPPHRDPWIKQYNETSEEGLGFELGAFFIPAAMGGWYVTTSEVDISGSVVVWLKY